MERVMTPFDGIEACKPEPYQPATPEEDAAVVAMTVAGAKQSEIAKKLGRNHSWVWYRKQKMAVQIAEYRQNILEDTEEDMTDVISLSLYRMREQLTKDKMAKEIPARDLAQIHRNVFNARQLMRKGPTEIPGAVPGTDLTGKKLVDAIAIAEEFNKNFEHLQRAAINAMAVNGDVEEGDFVDCPPD